MVDLLGSLGSWRERLSTSRGPATSSVLYLSKRANNTLTCSTRPSVLSATALILNDSM